MKSSWRIAALVGCLLLVASGQAAYINLNTGIDADGNNIDDNWTLASVVPSGNPPPPGGLNLPNAYLTTSGWPLAPAGPWLANNAVSKWITYSSPLQVGGDITRDYDYQLTFYTTGGQVPIRWLSDNSSLLYLDNALVGSRPEDQPFLNWNAPVFLNLTEGMHTLDVVVRNIGQSSGNPTGVRVEFATMIPVPEPSTYIAGGLLLIPLLVQLRRWKRAK